MVQDSEDGDSVFDDGRGLALFLIVSFFVFSRIVCVPVFRHLTLSTYIMFEIIILRVTCKMV